MRANYFDNWDGKATAALRHLAQLRSASEAQVHALFPDLFKKTDAEMVPAYDAVLPSDALAEGVESSDGIIPILVTAPHGGHKTHLNGYELPYNPHAKARDGATAEIARDVRTSTGDRLPLLIDLVRRQYRTPETRTYFETQTFLHIAKIRRHLEAQSPLLHIDLHGFKPTVGTEGYDLIIGTGHRTTMGGLSADNELADYMQGRGYSVYLPRETPRTGEFYMADQRNTLVQRVASLGLKNTGSIQIEISATFRTVEHLQDGKRLAEDLGTFCVKWADAY